MNRSGRTVLTDLNFVVAPSSVTGLLGPSGSGKTTLMRCLVGIQIVRAGSVTLLGRPAGAASLRGDVGYMTQAPSVYDDLSVRESARYFASRHGVSGSEADRAVAGVGLDAAAAQVMRTLSGGQRAHASLACALISRPKVLLLDEPTVGQDPLLRNEL